MGEFMHNSLIKAGSKGAVENMLTGAGVGAVANVGLGMTQGDFGVVGNATSGGMMGAIGGAGARHFGAQYVDGLRSMAKKGEYTNKFKTSMFTEATKMDEKARQDFMGTNANFGKFNQEKYNKKGGFDKPSTPSKEKPKAQENTQEQSTDPKKGQPEVEQTSATPNQTSGRIDVEKESGIFANIGERAKTVVDNITNKVRDLTMSESERETRKAFANADEYQRYQKTLENNEINRPSLTGQKTKGEILREYVNQNTRLGPVSKSVFNSESLPFQKNTLTESMYQNNGKNYESIYSSNK